MRIISIFAIFFMSFVFVFTPISISGFINPFSRGASVEEISGYQEWNVDRTIDKNVIVKAGATLVIGKGVKVDFIQPGLSLSVNGKLYVKGTLNEPVYIGSSLPDGGLFSIQTNVGSNTMIRNVEISSGGMAIYMAQGLKNTAAAAIYMGALHVAGGKADIQNVTFKNNIYAVYVSNASADVRVNRSRFIDNESDVYAPAGDDFRYNWWASPDGPTRTCYGPSGTNCYYDKIIGSFDHSKHLTRELFQDPVVIVPGLVGSKEKDGVTILDPVLHTYDNLYDAFVASGYVPEKDLFVFPYQWRDSNVDNAKLLQQKINEIKQAEDWPKVDIVAHSMGGLLAREYAESDYYGNDIDQLVTVATPHLGAPEAYLKWDGDGWFFSLSDLYIKHIISQEAAEAGFADRFDYIHDLPIASIRELLPVYDYLYDIDDDNQLRAYPDNYPRNEFLENLNTKADRLYKVEFDKIVGGLGNDSSTISALNVINVDMGKYWAHGYLPGFEVLSERGFRYSDGDVTVPVYSAKSENLKSDNTIELISDHRSIVTDAQSDVLELLTGNRPQEEVRRSLVHRMLFVSVYSPVDIQIVSPSEKRMGKNFETGGVYDEIPGAYYTGYDTKSEFITIPNPEDGGYKILAQGTDAGSYRIEVAKIVENEDGNAKESTVSFTGTAVLDAEEETIVMIEGDEVSSGGIKDETAPTTAVSFSGTQGQNGWYTTDVTVILTATDNENGSGVEKTEYSFDSGATWNVYVDPILIFTEDITTIQYRSVDKAGNQEETKTEIIKIDKTAPEAKISFNPATQKLEITGKDNLSEASVTILEKPELSVSNKKVKKIKDWFSRWHDKHKKNFPDMLATITDQAGHTTSLTFEKTKDRKGFVFVRLLSIGYDGNETALKNTDAQYKWKIDRKGEYQPFASSLRTGEIRFESHYFPKKDETWIMEKPQDLIDDDRDDKGEARPVRQKLSGMVILYFESKVGEIGIKY